MIATEKKLPTILVDETSSKKIEILSENAGIVYSGLGPDYRVLVRKARKKAQTYFQKYKVPGDSSRGRVWWRYECLLTLDFLSQEHAPASILVRELAAIMQEFTQSGGVRPFGVSILFAGYDDDGPQLYQIDPSGAYFGWKATAIGKDSVSAETFLERVRGVRRLSSVASGGGGECGVLTHRDVEPAQRYNDDLEIEDAIHTALLTLREGFEGEVRSLFFAYWLCVAQCVLHSPISFTPMSALPADGREQHRGRHHQGRQEVPRADARRGEGLPGAGGVSAVDGEGSELLASSSAASLFFRPNRSLSLRGAGSNW